jgi:hypothetical protein
LEQQESCQDSMLVVYPGSEIEIPFVYKSGFSYVDPTDVISIFLKRGYGSSGAVIIGPVNFNITNFTSSITTLYSQDNSISLEKLSQGSYILKANIPSDLFEGMYTVQISTIADNLIDLKEHYLQCQKPTSQNNETFSPDDKQVVINNRSKYQPVNNSETNNIVLIGHTDALEPFSIYKASSIQDAINSND